MTWVVRESLPWLRCVMRYRINSLHSAIHDFGIFWRSGLMWKPVTVWVREGRWRNVQSPTNRGCWRAVLVGRSWRTPFEENHCEWVQSRRIYDTARRVPSATWKYHWRKGDRVAPNRIYTGKEIYIHTSIKLRVRHITVWSRTRSSWI